MDEDFLLSTPTARHLYHTYAENMPIIDYHCHLSPKEIAEDHRFSDIGELMLGGDHYKWRAMSAYGFDNGFIRTSDTKSRFFAFAKAMPSFIGNPLYHWTHLELKRVFDITEPLSEATAESIWSRANALLAEPDFGAKGLISRFGVRLICTTDDPVDDLHYHDEIARDRSFLTKVLPAFRPDKAIKAGDRGFAGYIARLGEVSGIPIESVSDVVRALESRVEFFHAHGARISDHALDTVPFESVDEAAADRAFRSVMAGNTLSETEIDCYRTYVLTELGRIYREHNWVQQYHMNALRNVNSPLFDAFGPDVGGDTVNDRPVAEKLAKLMDAQEKSGGLPKTILYTLNPGQNYALAAMAGSFQGGVRGKIQFGSGWWFCDQMHGMREQMQSLASIGLLSTFVGMLTDSRSFVSYPRHEYFRRILCDLIGAWVENGEYPQEEASLSAIIRGICYENAENYFGIKL